MDEPDPSVGRHITSITTRSAAEADALLSAVRAHCWPSGSSDGTTAPGREWARRWHPARGMVHAVVCGCATGLCTVCN